MEIGRALLKCESEIASTHNWRLVSLMHSQLEILPKYFPSDFIYSHFVPMVFFRILNAVSRQDHLHMFGMLKEDEYKTVSSFFFYFRDQYLSALQQQPCFSFFYAII